jgi:hypothetical protein
MREVHRKRLERLAQLMENWGVEKKLLVAPEGKITKFNISRWHCGTAACVLGAAAMFPEFNKQGLKLAESKTCRGFHYPIFRGHYSYESGEKFFGLNEKQAEYLFDPAEYKSGEAKPATVAKRIREILSQ